MRLPKAKLILFAVFCGCFGAACTHAPARSDEAPAGVTLTLLSNGQNVEEIRFLSEELNTYRERNGISVKGVAGSDSIDTHLKLLKELFGKRSPEPEICEIDNIWPGMLADDLLDMTPYLGDETTAIDKSLLDAFTVNGRLIALPESIDTAMLYYRTDLLKKYGYASPPRTWDELGRMAKVIQDGERKAGAADFWGYLWQGVEGESLNCNAMEWQHAEGADLIGKTGKVCAYGPAAELAIRRARSWVGIISPPSIVEYDEEDTTNAWLAGSAAFARNWLSMYEPSRTSSVVGGKFGAVALPAGNAGYAWTFGGMGWGVSRYSRHPKEAVDVARYLVSAAVQKRRSAASFSIPSRTSLRNDPVLSRNTAFNGWFSEHWQQGTFSRPSAIAGKKYDVVSRAYSKAVHDAISGKRDTHQALMDLQAQLVDILR